MGQRRATSRWSALIACAVAAIAINLGLPGAARGAEAEAWVVRGGHMVQAAYGGDPWVGKTGWLEGSGKSNPLWAPVGIGKGDFRIAARLRLVNQERSGASFMLDGNHLGFEGSRGEIYVNGSRFGGLTRLMPSADVFPSGEWFEFEVNRSGGEVRYAINGKEVFRTDYGRRAIEKIGFYPLRATVQIQDFSISGDVVETPVVKEALTYTKVFHSGHEPDGHHTYRIPSLVTTARGTVLAFAEGRTTRHDHAGNDLVMKRSLDGGWTWEPVRVLVEDGDNAVTNPTAVVLADRNRVLLMYTRYPVEAGEREAVAGYEGPGVIRVFVIHSDDEGATWSEPLEVTRSVKRPTGATSVACGPGTAIQLRRGPHRGRIVVPFNQGPTNTWKVYAAFSDDGGASWRYGDLAKTDGDFLGNETQMVELEDGRIMLNTRLHGPTRDQHPKTRGVAYSDDGGQTWSSIVRDPALPDPTCQGSILRISDPLDGMRGRILFSNPASARGRTDGAVRLSYDDGKTWLGTRPIWPDNFAYSCLSTMPDMSIGCLFEYWKRDESRPEGDQIENILYIARFPLSWLSGGQSEPGWMGQLREIDVAQDRRRQVIVDRQDGQYLGHPTTVLFDDGQTLLTAYPMGHGRGQIVLKRSVDGGRTWSDRLPVPENWSTGRETPTIHRVVDAAGTKRLILFSGLYPIRMSVSEDEGETWTPLAPIGDFGGIVAMSDLVQTGTGEYLAIFHDDGKHLKKGGKRTVFTVYTTRSTDGGLTWSEPTPIASVPHLDLCEPGAVWSPDGSELTVLLRENSRNFHSFMIRSRDRGKTWSEPVELPASLTGDRHVARYAPDGRLVVVFRDMAPGSATYGDFVAWIGAYEDLAAGNAGQTRIRLLDNKSNPYDTGYAGLEVLPDGTFVATTYCVLEPSTSPLVVSVRFRADEWDDAAARATGPSGAAAR